MAEKLKGAPVSLALKEEIRDRVNALGQEGIVPALTILRVGEREDDLTYERGILKQAEACGVRAKVRVFPDTVSQEELILALEGLNEDPAVHGVLLFCPLPGHLDERAVRKALKPEKDIDGITDASLFGVFAGREGGYPPCTPEACVRILKHYNIPLAGKRAVVVGRSLVVGRPLAMLLMAENATVTICHTKTEDLPSVCREADILIAAAGRKKILNASHVREGQVVLDVGIHAEEDGCLCGDVDFEEVFPRVFAITPVPGGVGTVTTSLLLLHVISAAEKSARLRTF
ncbi:MAG: bifunctional 5,10-methylenetetrahydrofolate dehydrogenase/5,10-methenyltetrahydrofolate cyclohydrolase [Lachnospiraceae bacterium]|nr:bifunctional 5,10-methylenetetrahydrofolate dehydrogenase/5,10-methenyltetrahydrofolate cyclohydrolase [Lachnospiraceae bacterium]